MQNTFVQLWSLEISLEFLLIRRQLRWIYVYMYAHWCTCKLVSLVGEGGSGSLTKKKKMTTTWKALDHVQILLFSLLVFHRIAKHTGLDWTPHYHLVCSLSSYPLECTFWIAYFILHLLQHEHKHKLLQYSRGISLPPALALYHLVIFSFISLLSLCQAARVFACVRPFTSALKPDSSNLSYLFHLWPHPTHNTRLISNWVYNLYPWWIFWKTTESMMGPQLPLFHGTCMRGYYYSLLLRIHSVMLCLEKSRLHFFEFFCYVVN